MIIRSEYDENPSTVNYDDEEIRKFINNNNLELADLSYLRKLSKEESFKLAEQEVKSKLNSKTSSDRKSPEK